MFVAILVVVLVILAVVGIVMWMRRRRSGHVLIARPAASAKSGKGPRS
jgi:hypothetical protein